MSGPSSRLARDYRIGLSFLAFAIAGLSLTLVCATSVEAPDYSDDDSDVDSDEFALVAFAAMLFCLVGPILCIGAGIWMYQDAEKRGGDGGLWLVGAVFILLLGWGFFPFFFLLIFLVVAYVMWRPDEYQGPQAGYGGPPPMGGTSYPGYGPPPSRSPNYPSPPPGYQGAPPPGYGAPAPGPYYEQPPTDYDPIPMDGLQGSTRPQRDPSYTTPSYASPPSSVTCPHCRQEDMVPPGTSGQVLHCSHCGQPYTSP